MRSIDQELVINVQQNESVDVSPNGIACFSLHALGCHPETVVVAAQAAGFFYKICGHCGTVNISRRP